MWEGRRQAFKENLRRFLANRSFLYMCDKSAGFKAGTGLHHWLLDVKPPHATHGSAVLVQQVVHVQHFDAESSGLRLVSF